MLIFECLFWGSFFLHTGRTVTLEFTIDLIATMSIIETEYLLNPGPASPYIVLTVTDHTNLMLSIFHPPTYILQFLIEIPTDQLYQRQFLTNHERLNSKPTQGQLRQLSSISNFFDKFRLV